MKVPALTTLNQLTPIRVNVSNAEGAVHIQKNDCNSNITNLSGMPYVYPVSFTAYQNSSKLRGLFAYGLPCMYTGIKMIDPKRMVQLLNTNAFSRSTPEVISILDRFKDSLTGNEAKVFNILKSLSLAYPEKNLQELLKEVEPIYKRRLRKKQAPIFKKIIDLSHELPNKYKYPFKCLMDDTHKKLDEKPVVIPFSSYEYKYILEKVRQELEEKGTKKEKRVIKKLIEEAKKFANSTNSNTLQNQTKVLRFQEIILKQSVLKDHKRLKSLVELSKSRLKREEVILPFSKKTFLYDLEKVLKNLHNRKLKEKMLSTAQGLPTSQESLSAFVLKLSANPHEKIGYKLLWPSVASIEHLLPRSSGGVNELANYGSATTRANSSRKSIDFCEQLRLYPETRQNCQKYVDRLIELNHQGVFRKLGLTPKYIIEFKNTILKLSNYTLDLDISKR